MYDHNNIIIVALLVLFLGCVYLVQKFWGFVKDARQDVEDANVAYSHAYLATVKDAARVREHSKKLAAEVGYWRNAAHAYKDSVLDKVQTIDELRTEIHTLRNDMQGQYAKGLSDGRRVEKTLHERQATLIEVPTPADPCANCVHKGQEFPCRSCVDGSMRYAGVKAGS